MLRHALVLAASAAAAFWLAQSATVGQPPLVWLAGAAVLGLLAGAVGRTWLGMPFLLLGCWLGVLIGLHLRAGSGVEGLSELSAAGPWLLGSVVVMLLAYVCGSVLVAALGRPRRTA